jgi:hypothetical protein
MQPVVALQAWKWPQVLPAQAPNTHWPLLQTPPLLQRVPFSFACRRQFPVSGSQTPVLHSSDSDEQSRGCVTHTPSRQTRIWQGSIPPACGASRRPPRPDGGAVMITQSVSLPHSAHTWSEAFRQARPAGQQTGVQKDS